MSDGRQGQKELTQDDCNFWYIPRLRHITGKTLDLYEF